MISTADLGIPPQILSPNRTSAGFGYEMPRGDECECGGCNESTREGTNANVVSEGTNANVVSKDISAQQEFLNTADDDVINAVLSTHSVLWK
jgi:hypothetical protein